MHYQSCTNLNDPLKNRLHVLGSGSNSHIVIDSVISGKFIFSTFSHLGSTVVPQGGLKWENCVKLQNSFPPKSEAITTLITH